MVQDLEFKNGSCHHRMLERAHKKQSNRRPLPPPPTTNLHKHQAPLRSDPSIFLHGAEATRRCGNTIMGRYCLQVSLLLQLRPSETEKKKKNLPYQGSSERAGGRKSSHLRFGTNPEHHARNTARVLQGSTSRKSQTINRSPA